MEFRQLKYFIAVAEELHFGRAAEKLGIAQPPLSQQIQKLESDLGTRLFDRTSRRVSLTASGSSLLVEARYLLQRAESLQESLKHVEAGFAGHLDIGAVSPAIDTFLPALIQKFLSDHKNTRVTLHEVRSHEQIKWIQNGKLDIGFIRLFEQNLSGMKHCVVQKEQYVLAVPSSHELSRRKSISLSHLDQVPMVMAPRQARPELHDQIISCCQNAGANIRIVQEATSKRTEVALVAAGIGFAFVPESYARIFSREGVVYRPIRGTLPPIEIAAIWLAENISKSLIPFVKQLKIQ